MLNKLDYGGGNIELNVDLRAIVIEIIYKGNVKIYPLLGADYDVNIYKNRIIVINKYFKDINKAIEFKYRGKLRVISAKLTDSDKNIHRCSIVLSNVDLWGYMKSNWETNEKQYHEYNKELSYKPKKLQGRNYE